MDEENPFEDRRVRSLVGLASSLTIAVIAVLFFEGIVMWALIGFAAVDLVLTPYILKMVAEGETETEQSGFES